MWKGLLPTGALRRQTAGFWAVAVFASVGEAFWFCFVNLGFFMDSSSYLRYANVLIGRNMPFLNNSSIGHQQDFAAISRRTIGYPLILLLGVVPPGKSFIGVLLIQAAMAVAIPLLAYKIIEPYHRRAAFFGAVFLVMTLEPFNYSKDILTEQTFKFLLLLTVYLSSAAYRSPNFGRFAVIAVVSSFSALVRPQASLIAVVIFFMLALVHWTYWKSLVFSFAIVLVTLGASSLFNAIHLASYVPEEFPAELQRQAATAISPFGKLLFENVYTSKQDDSNALDPRNGVERKRLAAMLEAYLAQFPQDWTQLQPSRYFAIRDQKEMLENIYNKPNPFYENMILAAVAKEAADGSTSADKKLLWQVISEAYLSNFQYTVNFAKRYLIGLSTSTGPQQSWDTFYISGLSPFSASNGPYSSKILQLAQTYIDDFPGYLPPPWRNYPGGADKLIDDVILKTHSEGNFWFFWEIVDRLKGRLESGNIFLKSLAEFPNIGYLRTLSTIDKLGQIFLGMPTVHLTGTPAYDDAALFLFSGNSTDLPPRMQKEILSGLQIAPILGPGSAIQSGFVKWYTICWLIGRDVINVVIAATFLFCLRTRARWTAALMAVLLLYNALVIALVADDYIRYIDVTIPISITLAALSAGAFFTNRGCGREGLRSNG